MAKGRNTVAEDRINKGVPLRPRVNTGKKPAPEPSKQKKEPKPDMVKEEQDEKLMGNNGRMTPSDIRELKNRVTMQRIRISQLKDGIEPTVPDHGIIFNNKNNVWLRPKAVAEKVSGKKPEDNEEGDNKKNESGRDRGGPPSDDGSSGDESGDDDRRRDPFMPRPSSHGASSVMPA